MSGQRETAHVFNLGSHVAAGTALRRREPPKQWCDLVSTNMMVECDALVTGRWLPSTGPTCRGLLLARCELVCPHAGFCIPRHRQPTVCRNVGEGRASSSYATYELVPTLTLEGDLALSS